jgi:DNA-directed RNA polymerase specialized sigma subunit
MNEYQGIKGMGFDSVGGGGTNQITRTVENEVMLKEIQINRMKAMINEIERRISNIEISLESLTEIEREIIKNRYFEGLNFYDVAAIVGYSFIHT